MKRTVLALTSICVVACLVGTYMLWQRNSGPLAGLIVVIDSGHGGVDPGSHGKFPGPKGSVTIREDEYVYDVSCRLFHLVEEYGGIPIMTIEDPTKGCEVDSRPANEIIASDQLEEFALDHTQVTADAEGLGKRVAFANAIQLANVGKRVVYIAVHFDATGSDKLQGAHFIAPEGEKRELTAFLTASFREGKRLRKENEIEYHPVTYSGDPATGTIKVFVLSPKTNMIRQRVLIELGNFTNSSDVWRIRDPNVRQDYAELMRKALTNMNTLPLEEFSPQTLVK